MQTATESALTPQTEPRNKWDWRAKLHPKVDALLRLAETRRDEKLNELKTLQAEADLLVDLCVHLAHVAIHGDQ